MTRVLLGPVLVSLLLGIALYGAFCVNMAPTVQPAASPTLVLLVPASPSPTVYVFASPSPTAYAPFLMLPDRLPIRSPEPTATSTPTPLPPTHTPEPTATPIVPMRQRG